MIEDNSDFKNVPNEVKLLILAHLPRNDVAALAQTSQSMHHLINRHHVKEVHRIADNNQHILDIINSQGFLHATKPPLPGDPLWLASQTTLDSRLWTLEDWCFYIQSELPNPKPTEDAQWVRAIEVKQQVLYLLLELLFILRSSRLNDQDTQHFREQVVLLLNEQQQGNLYSRFSSGFIDKANACLDKVNEYLIFEHLGDDRLFNEQVRPDVDTLILNNLGITRISSETCNVLKSKELKRLYMNGNALFALNPRVGDLSTLVVLDVSQNYLHHLPSSIGQLIHLKHFPANQNLLRTLPLSMLALDLTNGFAFNNNAVEHLPLKLYPWIIKYSQETVRSLKNQMIENICQKYAECGVMREKEGATGYKRILQKGVRNAKRYIYILIAPVSVNLPYQKRLFSLHQMPDSVIDKILSHLEPQDKLSLAMTCHLYHRQARLGYVFEAKYPLVTNSTLIEWTKTHVSPRFGEYLYDSFRRLSILDHKEVHLYEHRLNVISKVMELSWLLRHHENTLSSLSVSLQELIKPIEALMNDEAKNLTLYHPSTKPKKISARSFARRVRALSDSHNLAEAEWAIVTLNDLALKLALKSSHLDGVSIVLEGLTRLTSNGLNYLKRHGATDVKIIKSWLSFVPKAVFSLTTLKSLSVEHIKGKSAEPVRMKSFSSEFCSMCLESRLSVRVDDMTFGAQNKALCFLAPLNNAKIPPLEEGPICPEEVVQNCRKSL